MSVADVAVSSDGSTFSVSEPGSTERLDDICVSMAGFIIALVVTALLAMVAVAVAVSCWLIAYRRAPLSVQPLPHPMHVPNPALAKRPHEDSYP